MRAYLGRERDSFSRFAYVKNRVLSDILRRILRTVNLRYVPGAKGGRGGVGVGGGEGLAVQVLFFV